MEGSESEAAFDAYNLNPQRFINEVLNSLDDMIDGAFEFSLRQASEITVSSETSTETPEELARGVSAIRQLTQAVLDKRMEMWEKYCLRHCFTVPDGFVLPKSQNSSSNGLLFEEEATDAELDSQLDSLRNKLTSVRKRSLELQKEIRSLENQSTVSGTYHSYIAEAMQIFEENSADKLFREIGEAASVLQSKVKQIKSKQMGKSKRVMVGKTISPSKKQHMAHDPGLFANLEDIQKAATLLKGT